LHDKPKKGGAAVLCRAALHINFDDTPPFPSSGNIMSTLSPPIFDLSSDFDFEFPLGQSGQSSEAPTSFRDWSMLATAMDVPSTFAPNPDAQPDPALSAVKLEEMSFDLMPMDTFKNEVGVEAGSRDANLDSGELWHSSQLDLMQIILDEDPANSNFNIRLNDDLYIEANKESALHVFGVVPLLRYTYVTSKRT
jgi:hypothetical protein